MYLNPLTLPAKTFSLTRFQILSWKNAHPGHILLLQNLPCISQGFWSAIHNINSGIKGDCAVITTQVAKPFFWICVWSIIIDILIRNRASLAQIDKRPFLRYTDKSVHQLSTIMLYIVKFILFIIIHIVSKI